MTDAMKGSVMVAVAGIALALVVAVAVGGFVGVSCAGLLIGIAFGLR